ncbi:MAG: hypothetical protein AAFU70_13170, partial [Planctomycetota bacterium]
VGSIATTPEDARTLTDVCAMGILGYDPIASHTGWAPIEAAALGLKPRPEEWLLCADLVCVSGRGDDDTLDSHEPEDLDEVDSARLFDAIDRAWRDALPDLAKDLDLARARGHRAVLVDTSGRSYEALETEPPQEMIGEVWSRRAPDGPPADDLGRLIAVAAEVLEDHEVNRERASRGLRPANMLWLWGQGPATPLRPFRERFELSAAMLTTSSVYEGLARLAGFASLRADGDLGEALTDALDRYDLVCCAIDGPERASRAGDWEAKVRAIEAADRGVVGPLLDKLHSFGDAETEPGRQGWRMLALADATTMLSTRTHEPDPTPLVMAGSWVRSVVQRPFNVAAAAESDLLIDRGHELLEYCLFSGRTGAR